MITLESHSIRRIIGQFMLAASSAVLWGSLAGIPFVAVLTFVTIFLQVWPLRKERAPFLQNFKMAFLYGGTWAAWGLIVTYRIE